MTPDEIRELAEAIAADLFTAGNGDREETLHLLTSGNIVSVSGEWATARRIEQLLVARMTPRECK